MGCGVLTTKPANEVPIVEIEGNQCLAEELGAQVDRQGCVVRVLPRKAQEVEGSPGQLEAELGVGLNGGNSER